MRRNRQTLHSILFIFTVLCVIVFGTQLSLGGTIELIDDGPHVYWSGDTSAIVFYYCNDSVISRRFSVRDTLRFSGFCADTDQSYTVPLDIAGPGPDELDSVARFFAVSDIHGDYEHLTEILLNTGIVDSSLHWRWGNSHLVIDGDVFDRGAAVTECLWLIYRLEQEAIQAGGAVHFILGNHELMVLRGDLRYVHERYTAGIAKRNRFTYDDLFGPDMALGRWLRTKQTVLSLNSTLFVHGGISTDLVHRGLSLPNLNDIVRRGLDYSSPQLYYDSIVQYAYGSFGPLWYRGYTTELENRYPMITVGALDSVLAYYEVDRAVVGHTEHDSLTALYDGRVIAIDVDIEAQGGQQGLLWENGQFYRVDRNGVKVKLE
jgi:hypothetical protein